MDKIDFSKITKKQIIIGASCVVGLILLIVLATVLTRPRYGGPIATREDFIGKTFTEAKQLADKLGIRYDIDNGNGIYDWESEDTQIMNWITTVYDENDDRVIEYNRYTSHDFPLYKGWRISMSTDVKTEKQEADEKACRAKEGYTHKYKDGKVECEKSRETLCKEEGKIWYKNSYCKTQEEIDAEEKVKQEKEKEEKATEKKEETKKEPEQGAKPASEPAKESNSGSSSGSTSSAPSIDTIADACWAYGQSQGVHLTDYASTNIAKDGDYYQILMWHDDGSVWKCWYNPTNKDTFIEKK